MSTTASHPPQMSLSERFGQILAGMGREAAHQAGLDHRLAPLVLVLWSYLNRLSRRFDSLLTRLAAGKVPARPRDPAQSHDNPPRARSHSPGLPQGFGFLVAKFGWRMAGFASQLQFLLTEPEMKALLETQPRVVRMIRPLCRMAGQIVGPTGRSDDKPPRMRPAKDWPPRRRPDPAKPDLPKLAASLPGFCFEPA